MSNEHSVVIVGAGFSGIGMAARLRAMGVHDFVLLDRGNDLGGTWRDNSYPGASCDVPSNLYSFSFALNHDWSQFYSKRDELRSYFQACAERHELEPRITFQTEVVAACFVIDLPDLGGAAKLEALNVPVRSLVTFAGH